MTGLSFNNVVILPANTLPEVTPSFTRPSEYGLLNCYINPTEDLPFSYDDPTIHMSTGVNAWNSNNPDGEWRQMFNDQDVLIPNHFYVKNGVVKLNITGMGVEYYAWDNTLKDYVYITTYSLGGVHLIKPLVINSMVHQYQINDTIWTLRFGRPYAYVEHPNTDMGQDLKTNYVADGTTTDPVSGTTINMSTLFYAKVYGDINLVPANQATGCDAGGAFADDFQVWKTEGATATGTVSTDWSYFGSKSAKAMLTVATGSNNELTISNWNNQFAITPDTQYTIRMYFGYYNPTPPSLDLFFYSTPGGSYSTTTQYYIGGATEFNYIEYTFTSPSSPYHHLRIDLRMTGCSQGAIIYWDSCILVEGDTIPLTQNLVHSNVESSTGSLGTTTGYGSSHATITSSMEHLDNEHKMLKVVTDTTGFAGVYTYFPALVGRTYTVRINVFVPAGTTIKMFLADGGWYTQKEITIVGDNSVQEVELQLTQIDGQTSMVVKLDNYTSGVAATFWWGETYAVEKGNYATKNIATGGDYWQSEVGFNDSGAGATHAEYTTAKHDQGAGSVLITFDGGGTDNGLGGRYIWVEGLTPGEQYTYYQKAWIPTGKRFSSYIEGDDDSIMDMVGNSAWTEYSYSFRAIGSVVAIYVANNNRRTGLESATGTIYVDSVKVIGSPTIDKRKYDIDDSTGKLVYDCREVVMKTAPFHIKSDSIPADDVTVVGHYDVNEIGYNGAGSVALECFKQVSQYMKPYRFW